VGRFGGPGTHLRRAAGTRCAGGRAAPTRATGTAVPAAAP